jgi:hypothetical protein
MLLTWLTWWSSARWKVCSRRFGHNSERSGSRLFSKIYLYIALNDGLLRLLYPTDKSRQPARTIASLEGQRV